MTWRTKLLIGIVFFLGLCIIGRLFELQVLGRNFLGDIVYSRQMKEQLIPADRGRIFIYEDEDLYPLAININTYNLIVSPDEIVNSDIDSGEWLKKIAPYLDISNLDYQEDELVLIQENQETSGFKGLLSRLSQKDDFYELLKRKLTTQEIEAIKALNLPGIRFETVPQRYYPESVLFGHLTGFVSLSQDCDQGVCWGGTGQYGLEEFFNQELSGQPGKWIGEQVPGLSYSVDNIIKSPKYGSDIVLTIDRSIQFFTCQILKKAIKDYRAESGSIIVLDPRTGAVLSLCNEPNFDPNQYSQVKDYSLFKNPVTVSAFEPGSIFKVITMAGALDAKKITPETTYKDKGLVEMEGETIKNVDGRVYGYQTMTNVLEKSINTGAIFAVQELGRSSFRNYLKKFGFGSLTGIELPAEATGDISNLGERQEIYLATASFGQGITVTPIQMVNAVGVIANQGKLMKPYLVDSIIKDGQKKVRKPEFIRQVISPSAATTLTAMMVSVCENGYGKKARVNGYYVAGKTGTAQIPKSGGGYSDNVIHSFIGFAPANNPKFVALVKLDDPQQGNFADSTAAPTFGQLTEFILEYYNVPPDKSLESQ